MAVRPRNVWSRALRGEPITATRAFSPRTRPFRADARARPFTSSLTHHESCRLCFLGNVTSWFCVCGYDGRAERGDHGVWQR